MNINSDQIADDLTLLYADHGEAITWTQSDLSDDTPMTAIVTDAPRRRVPIGRDTGPLHDKAFQVRLSELPSGYDLQTARIEYGTDTFRVQDQQTDAHEINLYCQQL